MIIMKKDFIFNPSLKKHKVPLGALSLNEDVKLTIQINNTFNITDLMVVLYNEDGEVFRKYFDYIKDDNGYKEYSVIFSINKPYIYWYYFEFKDCYGKHYLGATPNLDVKLYDYDVPGFQINVYEGSFSNLDWYKGKVMYQIMVDRFYKGGNNPIKEGIIYHANWDDCPLYKPVNGKILNNDYFGGDLQGIIKKIPYLKKLNVSVIYLNPIFLAPSNHKYNTSDYMQVDPMFGTTEDLKMLIDELKKNDMYLILDGVFNHTGDDSIYFNKKGNFDSIGAFQSKESPYYDWYRFIKYPNKYECWWGIDTLPAVNQNSGFVEYISGENGVIKKWIDLGIKGFRLDVVDEINDKFLRKICKQVKYRKDEEGNDVDIDNIVIGEVWEDASNKIAYDTRREYFNGHELDSVMNYEVKNGIIDYLKNGNIHHLINKLRALINNFPKKVIDSMMNILSTHDTSRILTEFSNVNYYTLSQTERANFKLSQSEYYVARSKLKMATLILYTIPGIPCIYYGEETGLEGYKDPFCRRTLPWNNIDNDILKWYQKLGEIRKDPIFIDGIYQELFYDGQVFAYSRTNNLQNQMIITIINNGNYEYKYNFDQLGEVKEAINLLTNQKLKDHEIIYPQNGVLLKIIK